MKYLLFLFVLFVATTAHSQCSEFDNLLKKGDNYLKGSKPNYQEAINAFTAAILACSDRAGEAKQRITRMVNEINKLRERTSDALKQVEKEKAATEEQRQKADDNFRIAQQATKDAQAESDNAKTALANLEKALADIQDKNLAIFESFVSLGVDLIYTLEHAEALEKMEVAVKIEVAPGLKKQRLAEPVAELLYFFAESGRRPALARTAARLLLQLSPESELEQTLQQCEKEDWNTRTRFGPLLRKLPSFSKFQARYYPEPVDIPLGADGIFEMGSYPSEWKRQPVEQLHLVKLSAYRIAATPTTFFQFALFCEAMDRSLTSRIPHWGRFGDHPVVNVNWYEALEYANWLNVQQGGIPAYEIRKVTNSDPNNRINLDFQKWEVTWNPAVKGYRLPTEAEWELAARAGTDAPRTLFAGSDTLDVVGWFRENSGDNPLSGDWELYHIYDNNCRTHPVRQKKDNGIGIYDMCGNVYEWCWDWYNAAYYNECKKRGIVQDPTGAKNSAEGRVLRGGGWSDPADYCRTARRCNYNPGHRGNSLGFRLVYVP
jgi:formylglycine-generating enzyme required for sulfatase activity